MSANPVTDILLAQIDDGPLRRWVERWDELEKLAIEIYRRQRVGWWDKRRYRRLRSRLKFEYRGWRDQLTPYWQRQTAGGKPRLADPFISLLTIERAEDLVDNWQALQLLPAAREALNDYLVSRLESSGRTDSQAGKG